MKKNTKNNTSSLKTIARLLLTVMLIATQVTTTVTTARAEDRVVYAADVSKTSSVTINGVTYKSFCKDGQVQLTAGDKVILLSEENIMAAAYLDNNGTVWSINYRGICAGYNNILQKNETSINWHKYLNNAEGFIFSGEQLVGIKTTTGPVSIPTFEEFKRLAGITTQNPSTGNNTSNSNVSNTVPNTTGKLNLFETVNVGNKKYTFVVIDGKVQVLLDQKVINFTEENVCAVGVDSNGTIHITSINNGIKTAKWYNPDLQKEVKLNVITSYVDSYVDSYVKDSSKHVTAIRMSNYSVMSVPTLEEQKKFLGISENTTTTTTTTTTKTDKSRVVPAGSYSYVVYDSNGNKLYKYTFKKGILYFKGKKYKNIVRVASTPKYNLAVTSKKGSIVIINHKTEKMKLIYSYTDYGKVQKYNFDDAKGQVVSATTTKKAEINLKKY